MSVGFIEKFQFQVYIIVSTRKNIPIKITNNTFVSLYIYKHQEIELLSFKGDFISTWDINFLVIYTFTFNPIEFLRKKQGLVLDTKGMFLVFLVYLIFCYNN